MSFRPNEEEFRKMSPNDQLTLIEKYWRDLNVDRDLLEFLLSTFIAQYLEGMFFDIE